MTSDTLQAFETFANPPRKELYDLTEDPGEYDSLAEHKELSETEEKLEEELQARREETFDPYLDSDYLVEMTAYYDHGADQQESRGARYSYQDGILFNVDRRTISKRNLTIIQLRAIAKKRALKSLSRARFSSSGSDHPEDFNSAIVSSALRSRTDSIRAMFKVIFKWAS